MDLPTLTPGQKLATGGSGLALVGAVLPWAATSAGTIPGYAINGLLSMMAAVTVLGVLILWPWRAPQQLVVAVFGVVIAGIAGNHALTVGTSSAVGTGIGAYLTLVAGLVVAGGGAYEFVQRRRQPPAEEIAQTK